MEWEAIGFNIMNISFFIYSIWTCTFLVTITGLIIARHIANMDLFHYLSISSAITSCLLIISIMIENVEWRLALSIAMLLIAVSIWIMLS